MPFMLLKYHSRRCSPVRCQNVGLQALYKEFSCESFKFFLKVTTLSVIKPFGSFKKYFSHTISSRGEYFIFSLDDATAPLIRMREWEKKAFHYDNCAMAMITLFAVQTSEGWIA